MAQNFMEYQWRQQKLEEKITKQQVLRQLIVINLILVKSKGLFKKNMPKQKLEELSFIEKLTAMDLLSVAKLNQMMISCLKMNLFSKNGLMKLIPKELSIIGLTTMDLLSVAKLSQMMISYLKMNLFSKNGLMKLILEELSITMVMKKLELRELTMMLEVE